MKKFSAFLLAFVLLFGLTACSGDMGDIPLISNTKRYAQQAQNTPTVKPVQTVTTTIQSTEPPDLKLNVQSTDAGQDEEEYIGNRHSKKFHYPSCHTLPKDKNRVYFNTRDEAIQNGYVSCKNCQP